MAGMEAQLQLEKLSTLGKWVYDTGIKYNVCNRTLTALNTDAEPDIAYLLGDRYYDLSLCLVFAVAIPLFRRMLKTFVSEPLGRRVMFGNTKKTDAQEDPERLRKWNESFWKMSIYIIFTTTAFAVCYGEVWATDSRFWWLGCTRFPPCNLPVSRGVLLFYCLETGFYLQSIHFLIFEETRRKDWMESMAHHVVTSGLLLYSYAVNFTRVGVVVILLHDVSDIFLEAAKLLRYARRATLAWVPFVMFFLSWVGLRCVIFPLFVIRSTLFEPVVLVAAYLGIEPRPHWEIFNGLLLVIVLLNFYWTWLILMVMLRPLLQGGAIKDVREQDDDDD